MPQDHLSHTAATTVTVPLAAVLLALLLPLGFAEVPPLLDYPNHLARAVILAGQVPEAAAWFAPDWRLLPNLAFDLLMMPLLRVLGPHEAGRVVVGLAAALGLLGTVAYHRAVFGRASWWPLGAALIAWHGLLLSGFLSFSIGTGIALLAAALWIGGGDRPSRARHGAFALLATLTALSHLFAFGFLGLLLLARILAARRFDAATALRLGVSFAPGAWIALQAFGGAGGVLLWEYHERTSRAFAAFAGYHVWLDRLAVLAVPGVLAAAALTRRLDADRGSLLAFGFCALAFLAMPATIGGGALAEVRFALFAALLLFAGLDVRIGWPAALPLAGLGAARLVVLGLAWNAHQADVAELRRALAELPRGAAMMTVAVGRAEAPAYFRDQRHRAITSFLYTRPGQHLGALAIVEQHARWPGLFAIPGQQPLRVLPPMERFSSALWHTLPPPGALDRTRPAPPGLSAADFAVWADWPQRFDYVLLLHARATPRPPEFATAPLAPVVDTGFAALYRVLR